MATETEDKRRPIILHVFSTLAVGGPQKRFVQIAGSTASRYRHMALANDGNYGALDLLGDASAVETLKSCSNQGGLIERTFRYASCLSRLKPDLIVTYNWGAIEWALATRLLKIPHIHAEDGFGPDESDTQLRRRVWFRRVALGGSSAIVVPSRNLERIAGTLWRLKRSRIRYIANGVPISPPLDDAARTRLRLDEFNTGPTTLLIGWVGALRPEKNVHRLLRAFASLSSSAELVLVGDGPLRKQIESEILALNLKQRVRLTGFRSDVAKILPAFNLLALSSDTEQMPIAVLEGMACGLPIASVNVGDVADMVAPENRQFVVPKDETELATAISALLSSPKLRSEIGNANRARAHGEFSLQRMIDAYVRLFDGTMLKRPIPADAPASGSTCQDLAL